MHSKSMAISNDCQALVKAMFNDMPFREALGLSGVNSINWARVMAQTVYYFVAGVALGAPHRPVSFTVPTGNFGDILAGYVAKRIGLPVARLVIATNVNDILARTLESGRHEMTGVTATTSPSMDIQISSNFERLIFDLTGRDAAAVQRLMDSLKQSGAYTLPSGVMERLREAFDAGRADEAETAQTIRRVFAETGEIIDTHTAVGVHVAGKIAPVSQTAAGDVPMVVLSTAHPAKFPDAVEAAIGQRPHLPEFLADLYERDETITQLPNDLDAVERHIRSTARIDSEATAGAGA